MQLYDLHKYFIIFLQVFYCINWDGYRQQLTVISCKYNLALTSSWSDNIECKNLGDAF